MIESQTLKDTDFLVIGSGIAGLSLALKLAQKSHVSIIAKGNLGESASHYAQGGIASVLGADDSFDEHIRDTMVAGDGLCHERIVQLVVEGGPQAINELIAMGVHFTKDDHPKDSVSSPYHLTREGGHSHRRVIHAEDSTGAEVMRALIAAAKAHPRISILENQLAVNLLTTDQYAPDFGRNRCVGSYVFDRTSRRVYTLRSQATILCTGGHGKVYLYTSNPDSATGDGLAMGWRAGCRVANLEFMQFHPTCLFHPNFKTFLISEAVRGEGGKLRNSAGEEFANRYHELGALAPRDIVARAIDQELKESGRTHVFLDVTQLGAEKINQRFPNIDRVLKSVGIDMSKEWIPVVPAAHYSCGGLVVNEWGQTNVDRLYALGEVACTGLHGANRLASNSLLEALVFADRVALHCADVKPSEPVFIPNWDYGSRTVPDELVVLAHMWDEIRRLMWHYVGIVRTDKRLLRAYDRINGIMRELDYYYWNHALSEQLIEVRNLAQVAYLTIRCAMARKESRGIHYNLDYPVAQRVEPGRDTILW